MRSFPRSVIARSRCFPQAIGQQDFGSDDFKAKTSPFSGQQLHETVQTFGVSGGVAVGEVVEDGIAIVLNCQYEGQESFVDIRRDLCKPGEVLVQSSFFCWCFIDGIKGFFETISDLQTGKVQEPCFKDQGFALIQIMRPSEQKEPIMHQGSALFVGQAFADVFTDGFQASREQFQDMEFVHDQMGMWQGFAYSIMITCPHIGANDGDLFTHVGGQALQVTDNGRFMAVSEQVNNVVIVNVSDDTAILVQQIQFVNAQIERLRVWKTRLNVSGELAKEVANQFLIDPHIVGDAGECSSQCLLVNIVDQAMSHKVVFIHVRNGLKEGAVAPATKIAFATNDDANAFSPDGLVQVGLRLYLVSVKFGVIAVNTTNRRSIALHLNMKIVFFLIYRKDTVVCQSQDIQIALSLPEVLPHEFSYSDENPVTQERRVLRVNCSYPTHFSDGALVCTSVKDDEIPRIYPISQFKPKGA